MTSPLKLVVTKLISETTKAYRTLKHLFSSINRFIIFISSVVRYSIKVKIAVIISGEKKLVRLLILKIR